MTPRERLLCVLRGGTPDHLPVLADLSWWHAAHGGGRFVPLTTGNDDRVDALLALHRRLGVAIHLNLGSFYHEVHAPDVSAESRVDGDVFTSRLRTRVGEICEVRRWLPEAWSWGIEQHMVNAAEDLKVIRYVFERVHYEPLWELFRRIDAKVAEIGLPFVSAPYTGMGFLISRYAGIERTIELAADEPDQLQQTVDTINAAHERVFRMLANGPSEVLFVSDNLSSDVQSPAWFGRYSAEHYRKLATIARDAGKPLSVHIDGRLRGLLRTLADCGVSAADAVTPAPWGDLTPAQCREEAGPTMVLCGGVPPDSFAESVPLSVFDAQVESWLALRDQSPALAIAPGDQLPPGGEIARVKRLVSMACA
jgi:uroporphyrinogen-III decarboxylase